MSIQRTAESALHALQELYNAIDVSSQQQSSMSVNDSENLVQALCNLSQLINHINQTGMCGYTPIMNTNLDSKRFGRKRINTFIAPHLTNYDENIMMDSAIIEPSLQPGQPYGECVMYHPIRIITTCADGSRALHESDVVINEGQYRRDHGKPSHSGSRRSRMSHRSQRSTHGRASQSRDRSSRSSRPSSSYSRSSKSRRRRSQNHGRRSRSSQRGSRRSRSSRSRSRRRSSHKRRSADFQNRQHHHHQIPSHLASNIINPTTSSYPSNQIGSTTMGIQPSTQQPYIRSLPSPAPITTTSNGRILPSPTFTPTIPLPPPPAISALHHPHSSSQIPMQQHHQLPSSSTIRDNNTFLHRHVNNPLSDQSSTYQQVPTSTISTGNTALLSQQQPLSLSSSTNPMLNIPIQNDVLSSGTIPLQTTNSALISRSDNCPECRAITRLLQWAPLKCYDAAGIRRGVFLAGPKSGQLLKALYSSIKDSSLSLDDIENCSCDDE
ncbi:unnamed protein product [Rotaria sp. Silwood1]|nr:unnamed protein product [Rotaria sp. Silwood1]CAF4575536.1 unnamed protein product [Rotaria sp. Silwood1]